MVQISVNIQDDTHEKFRQVAGQVYGAHRSSFSIAVEDALQSWLKQHENQSHT